MKVSVVIPCFNEEKTIAELIGKVIAVNTSWDKEIIVINDGSTDGTGGILENLRSIHRLQIITHEKNRGRGIAIRSGLAHISGDITIFQDGDLEYHPSDYPALLEPILSGRADIVYGSRFMHSQPWHGYRANYLFNRMISAVIRRLTGLDISDAMTGYKVFRSTLLKNQTFRQNHFGIDLELVYRIAVRHRNRFFQVPIRYTPRTYREGKKIGLGDACNMLGLVLRYLIVPPR